MKFAQPILPARIPLASALTGVTASGSTLDSGAGNDLELLLERFLVSILALAGAQAGAVRVLTDDGKFMRLVAQLGLPPQVLGTERMVEHDCGMCGIAVGADALAWTDDLRVCAKHSQQAYFGEQCRRALAISLPHADQVLGIYNLFFTSAVELSLETQNMLRLVGQVLGLTLYNAKVERERLRMTALRERQEMVNEVHDAIAQTLTYVKMRLPLLSDAMLAHDDTRSVKYFSDVKMALGEAHDNLREVMTDFRTRMDPKGLLHALQLIAERFFDRNAITLELRNTVQNLNLNDTQEIQVFHILQEALANIVKHSMAQHAVVIIEQTGEQLAFSVEDDGLGIAAREAGAEPQGAEKARPVKHLGLEIMQNRAHRLGGRLEVSANDGGGTLVRLLLPLTAVQQGSTG